MSTWRKEKLDKERGREEVSVKMAFEELNYAFIPLLLVSGASSAICFLEGKRKTHTAPLDSKLDNGC